MSLLIYLSIYLSHLYISIYLSIYPSFFTSLIYHLISIYPICFISITSYLHISYLSIYLSIYLSVYISLSFFLSFFLSLSFSLSILITSHSFWANLQGSVSPDFLSHILRVHSLSIYLSIYLSISFHYFSVCQGNHIFFDFICIMAIRTSKVVFKFVLALLGHRIFSLFLAIIGNHIFLIISLISSSFFWSSQYAVDAFSSGGLVFGAFPKRFFFFD
ncbi:unnamed protein product [Acanthosepion pharaonis]|uniref:Uncharacterized protein n=1 Tax=Acanthosepion pharaonis TaxID=158019 RepID=A0A812BX20_ACAPH|nr:unnamed protein product [Sepia pharaonis]